MGKTTILQALDCFFNERALTPNLLNSSDSSIIQIVFLIEKVKVPEEMKDDARQASNFLRGYRVCEEDKYCNDRHLKQFHDFLLTVPEKNVLKKYYIITIGIDSSKNYTNEIFSEAHSLPLTQWGGLIKELFGCIYIPIFPNPENFTEYEGWLYNYCKYNHNGLAVQIGRAHV